ncbi:NrsF family protein [Herbaspirillum seropedicae]|uniref:NrsF family protein n=1 Tax=Herbaspirillum seropedicae TaxID=964 RepID=UPI003FCEB8FC
MKTDDLISMMASGVTPVDRRLPVKQMAQALLLGGLGSVLLMLKIYGLRPDLGVMLGVPLFWIKLAFPTALAVGAMLVLRRLVRPGLRVGVRWAGIALPSLAVWAGGALVLLSAPVAQRLPLLMGISWRSCPFNIALLSIPLFIGIFWAVRGMAPTRLRLTGAIAGLLAGATATMVYCLHCPEMGVPFWGIWYFLGILIPAAAGLLLGPRLLRW